MPMFYFDIRCRAEDYRDEVGDAFARLDEAVVHVQGLLSAIARDHPLSEEAPVITCALRDEAGRIVYRGELTYRGFRLPA